jgi:hypothetical protein
LISAPAVTFDVVDRGRGQLRGRHHRRLALAALTDYLHERTAFVAPRIRIPLNADASCGPQHGRSDAIGRGLRLSRIDPRIARGNCAAN